MNIAQPIMENLKWQIEATGEFKRVYYDVDPETDIANADYPAFCIIRRSPNFETYFENKDLIRKKWTEIMIDVGSCIGNTVGNVALFEACRLYEVVRSLLVGNHLGIAEIETVKIERGYSQNAKEWWSDQSGLKTLDIIVVKYLNTEINFRE